MYYHSAIPDQEVNYGYFLPPGKECEYCHRSRNVIKVDAWHVHLIDMDLEYELLVCISFSL